MKSKIIIILFIVGILTLEIRAQLKKLEDPKLSAETEIFINEKGDWYSDIIRIGFAQKTIDLGVGKNNASISDIIIPEVSKIFYSIKDEYGNISLTKIFPDSYWGDTIGTNLVTKEKVILKDMSQFYKIKFDHIVCVDSIILILKKSNFFKSVERPEYLILAYQPDDYSASEQWALPKIDALKAWDITRGINTIKIGINDGFTSRDINNLHYELRGGKIVYNPNNMCSYHGQAVAGCASALTDNGMGISSISFNASLMFSTGGAAGINELRNNGADN